MFVLLFLPVALPRYVVQRIVSTRSARYRRRKIEEKHHQLVPPAASAASSASAGPASEELHATSSEQPRR